MRKLTSGRTGSQTTRYLILTEQTYFLLSMLRARAPFCSYPAVLIYAMTWFGIKALHCVQQMMFMLLFWLQGMLIVWHGVSNKHLVICQQQDTQGKHQGAGHLVSSLMSYFSSVCTWICYSFLTRTPNNSVNHIVSAKQKASSWTWVSWPANKYMWLVWIWK